LYRLGCDGPRRYVIATNVFERVTFNASSAVRCSFINNDIHSRPHTGHSLISERIAQSFILNMIGQNDLAYCRPKLTEYSNNNVTA